MPEYSIRIIESRFPDGISRKVFYEYDTLQGGVVAYLDIYGPFHIRSVKGTDLKDAATKLAELLGGELVVESTTPQGEKDGSSKTKLLASRGGINGKGSHQPGNEKSLVYRNQARGSGRN